MNSHIIPVGNQEVITDPASPVLGVLLLEAITEVVVTDITFLFPPTNANAGAVTAFTLPVGGHLFNMASIEFTGTATVTYRTVS